MLQSDAGKHVPSSLAQRSDKVLCVDSSGQADAWIGGRSQTNMRAKFTTAGIAVSKGVEANALLAQQLPGTAVQTLNGTKPLLSIDNTTAGTRGQTRRHHRSICGLPCNAAPSSLRGQQRCSGGIAGQNADRTMVSPHLPECARCGVVNGGPRLEVGVRLERAAGQLLCQQGVGFNALAYVDASSREIGAHVRLWLHPPIHASAWTGLTKSIHAQHLVITMREGRWSVLACI